MGDKITFDYFYGGQEETFSYYRIPRVLFTGQQFKGLSIGAKMLYGLLLDRMYLSSRNGWYDDQGRVYIYYPVEEIEETMGCGHNKAVRLLAELDEVKGIGLIERIRQGLGKPAKIYVKQFTTRAVPDTPRGPAPDSTPQPTGFNRDRQDVSKKDLQGYHNRTSRLLETGRADVPKADGNYKNKNYPYDSYHDLSINPSCRFPVDEAERRGIMEELKENIDYPQLATQHSLEDVDELLELTTDVLCSSRPTLRIGSEEVLYDSIKANGINEPVKARPREGGGLELLSGHRRHDIAKQLNYPVPVVIVQEDDDSARIEVVDGNLHRQDIPTSELARAAKMKMEALARKAGRRSKMDQLTGPSKRTDQIVAEDMGMSRNQVNRLVRIDALVPELKQQVDEKKLPFNTAVELSFLKPEEQGKVVDFIKKEQMFANSEFLVLYNQAATDRAELARLLRISDTQMGYITNSAPGTGLIRMGGAIVPFINTIPRNTQLYRLMSTTPGDEAES